MTVAMTVTITVAITVAHVPTCPQLLAQAHHDLGIAVESMEQVRRVTQDQPALLASVASVMRRFEEQEATLRDKITALSAVRRALRLLEQPASS